MEKSKKQNLKENPIPANGFTELTDEDIRLVIGGVDSRYVQDIEYLQQNSNQNNNHQ